MLRSVAHLFPISKISPWHSHLQWISSPLKYPMSHACHCTAQKKARPCLIPPSWPQSFFRALLSRIRIPQNKALSPPSCLQRFVPVAQTQTHWWQRKGDVIKRLTTAVHFTASINICTWVWGYKCRQKSGCWVGGQGHWFWLNLEPIYPKARRVICRHLMGYSKRLRCTDTTNMHVHSDFKYSI